MTKIEMTHSNGRLLRLSAGFSWLGFLTPQLWAMLNAHWRIWAISLVPVLLARVTGGLQEYCDQSGKGATNTCDLPMDGVAICAVLLQVALMGICGFRGNAMLMQDALKRGYVHTNVARPEQDPNTL
ncbi:hypothetical protein [Rhodoferax aquaticus]|uniref:DUF2628 domain-containing protein n=1 Tax=Rhodoferax aquaticus TaxID=2527691 RepID=A0A515ES30_9BURK|nr:hypothetical protein [Rhodoferax aquaticus]QDL55465.1 hypothetical protein EXZ61_15515 [Rhodoferax aquaticus]